LTAARGAASPRGTKSSENCAGGETHTRNKQDGGKRNKSGGKSLELIRRLPSQGLEVGEIRELMYES